MKDLMIGAERLQIRLMSLSGVSENFTL